MKKGKRIAGISICAAAVFVSLFVLCRYQNTSAVRKNDKYSGSIPRIVSTVDADGDGTDDLTDILEGALAYVTEKKPKYKSVYYNTGYSTDEYGVCTDVVANALLNAGYDLMQSVNEDILKNPQDYNIENPDINIDFRRVRNLEVYFSHTAVSLTTDIEKIEEWQGGDIVIFKNHIGIVSDRRNKNGVPYVIHHGNPFQSAYEQDYLPSRQNEITGHYRISE